MPKSKVWYFPLQNKLHTNVKRNSLFSLHQATSSCSTEGQLSTGTGLSLEKQLRFLMDLHRAEPPVAQRLLSQGGKTRQSTGTDHWAPGELPHVRKGSGAGMEMSVSTELSPTHRHPPHPCEQFLCWIRETQSLRPTNPSSFHSENPSVKY